MYDLYQRRDYPFRLMVAIQGWDPDSYSKATEEVLGMGYDYLGIGGVAGSPVHDVRGIVKSVGKTIKQFEREHNTRIDSHVFGFAKTEAFETIGRSGMTSFDSAVCFVRRGPVDRIIVLITTSATMPFEFAIHRAGTISTKLLKRPYAVVKHWWHSEHTIQEIRFVMLSRVGTNRLRRCFQRRENISWNTATMISMMSRSYRT